MNIATMEGSSVGRLKSVERALSHKRVLSMADKLNRRVGSI
jgi:hypothetical protein